MRFFIPTILLGVVSVMFSIPPVIAMPNKGEVPQEKSLHSSTLSKEVVVSLDSYFSQLAVHNKFMGSVGIFQGNEIRYLHANTFNQDKILSLNNAQLSPLKYRIGSITKVFTGVMVMQLIQEEKLSLNTKLTAFFPKVANADKITVAQMLNHHSGIKSFTTDPAILSLMYKPQSSDTILAMIESYNAVFEPGSKAEYSNSNFYLLAQIIEKVTGKTYQENLSSRITQPLKLNNTYYGGQIAEKNDEVNSYFWSEDKWHKSQESDMSVPHGAGAIVSTVQDLHQFIYALFNGDLINAELLTEMLTIEHDYGKGIFKMMIEGNETYSHDGLIDQFNSIFLYQPVTGLTIITLSNGIDFNLREVATTLLNASKGEVAKVPNFNEVKLSVDELSKFTGEYQSESFPLDITLFIENDELFAQATGQGPFPLTATSSHSFGFLKASINLVFDQTKLAIQPEFMFSQHTQKHLFVKTSDIENNIVTVSDEMMKAYEGVYKSPDFPLDITVFIENGKLMAQATGQGAFPLTAASETVFNFSPAGISIAFNQTNNTLVLSQGGVETSFSK